jgi:hypothetical protein
MRSKTNRNAIGYSSLSRHFGDFDLRFRNADTMNAWGALSSSVNPRDSSLFFGGNVLRDRKISQRGSLPLGGARHPL